MTVIRLLRRWFCAYFTGHRAELHMDASRVWFRCVQCDYESPGWVTGTPPPALRPRVVRFRRRLSA